MIVRPLIVPAVIAVFSVAVIAVALQLEESPPMIVGDSLQPRAFPIFLMSINLLLVGFLVAQVMRTPPETLPFEGMYLGLDGVVSLFYLLTVYLDMFIGIAVVMFALSFLWGERRIYVAALVALVTPVSVFFLFDLVLRVRFPRGVLTSLYYG